MGATCCILLFVLPNASAQTEDPSVTQAPTPPPTHPSLGNGANAPSLGGPNPHVPTNCASKVGSSVIDLNGFSDKILWIKDTTGGGYYKLSLCEGVSHYKCMNP